MEFKDIQWVPYRDLRRNKTALQNQVCAVYGTGLCEGNDGVEYCFVPTKKMEELEKDILFLYQALRTEDHEVTLCNEVYFTSKIEGANTTIKHTQEIHDGKLVDRSSFSEMMVLGGFQATKFLNVHGNKLTEPILIDMWKILTEGSRANESIMGEKYRMGNVAVGNHMGLHPDVLEETMSNWITFYNSPNMNDHPFIKAALLHYSFEFIHPFCDGNGRAGRLLMINYLIGQGFDKLKAVSFSQSIVKDLGAYYSAFNQSENAYTDCTPFIEYMLKIYDDALYDVVELYKDGTLESFDEIEPDK